MFADEENHYSREFIAAWPACGESAEALADKLLVLVRRLVVIEPAYGEVRPILAPRRFRPSDPGPILEMSAQDFGSLIDRRTRFDPPRFPAPVGQDGYSIVLGPDRSWYDPLRIGIRIRGGQYRAGEWDRVELTPHHDSPLWRETDLALSLLNDLMDLLSCQCVSASAFISEGERGYRRPWIAWSADGAGPLPYPFPFKDAPRAPQRTAYRGGELRIWP